MGLHTKVTRDGQILTQRVWDLIDYVGDLHGLTLEVVQGGFKAEQGGGADASAGVHDYGDVYDIRVRDIPRDKQIPVVVDLRRWGGCTWLRTPDYGWNVAGSGPHIHGVQRDSYYPLGLGARAQITSYDRGMNGLAHPSADPFPRPHQEYFTTRPDTGDDVALTNDEIEQIATRVWAKSLTRTWDGKAASAGSLLVQSHFYGISGGFIGTVPDSAQSLAGTPTTAKQLRDAIEADGTTTPAGSLSDADVNRIATKVADLLAERMKS